MDATQQIEDSFLGEEDDPDNEHDQAERKSEREPLAVLKVFKNNHIAETEVPLYQGENVLGRDPTSCSVPLQARSVSGHHAIISITVFGPNDHRAHSEATEAMLWDLGSLNGTRKGRSKLTPHVRYALTDGDGVVLADLPCQYVSLKNTEKNTDTATGEKARGQMSSSSSTEVETVKGVETIAKLSTRPPVPVWSNEVKSPQLQMTPKQPETTLVPESDSDSDGEKHRQRERRRIVASDSVSSDLSSPTCSTFLTPATKVIPESEDESSITPSPALKGRFQKAENDTEVSSSSSKPDPLHFNIDSDTDVEDDDAEMSKATLGTAAVVPAETVAVNPADLYMDSDTDAEEEEIGKVKSDPEASGLAPAKSDMVNPAALNMDSDTDVEEDKPVKTDVVSSSGPAAVLEEKKDAASSAKLHLESDTDVEEEEKVCHIQDIRSLSSLVGEFNMNSDTDVEEEKQTTKALVQPCKTDNHVPDAKMLPPESDSDTDVEVDDITDIRNPTVAREAGNSETAGERSTGTLHDSPVGAQPPAEALRDEIRLDSDTDVEEDEDKIDEKEQKCAEAAIQIVRSSTPRGAGLPEEEKETQAFLSPSQLFKRPGLPALLHPSVSPGGASHTDDDFAVAETQSFMCDAAQGDATLDETPQSLDEYRRSDGAPSFQMDRSDSSTNQMTEAEELNREPAEEDWQLQATQLYEGSTKSGPTPPDLDATQAFTDSIIREDEEDVRKEKEEEETQLLAASSHSNIHSETQLIKPGAQNKNPSDSDEKVGAGEPHRKAEEDVHNEMQADSHLSTADTLLIIRSPRQEEQTQPYAVLAENIQEGTEKEEHESKDQAVQQGGEGQRAQNVLMGHENNDERQTKEHESVVIEAKNDVTRDGAEDEIKKGTEDKREESEKKVDEVRTQPAEDDAIIETQPICTAKDDEEHEKEQLNEPSSSKGTWTAQGESAQCIKAKHHTRAAVAIAETLPMCEEEEEEQEEEENKLKNSRRPGRRRQPAETVEPKRSVESGNVTHVTIAETLPLCEKDNERQEEQSEAMSPKRSSIRRQNVKTKPTKSDECHETIPETLPLCDEEEGREEEPQNEAMSVRKSRRGKQTAKVEATQPLDADFTAETLKTEEKEEEPDGRKSLRVRAAPVKSRGRGRVAAEKDEDCEQEVDGGNKGTERKNLRQNSKNDDKARLKLVEAKNEELERFKKQEAEEESERLQETRDQLEREKSVRLEKEREEQEKREQEEKERIDHEKKAREEKEQIEREMKEREEKETFEREKRLEKDRREREEKEKLEKEKQEEKDRLAIEKREREEKEMRKGKEKQEKEMELREKEIKGNEESVEKEHRQAPGRRKTVRRGGKNKKEEEQDKDGGTKESRENEQELSEKQEKECEEGSSKKPEEELAESDAKPRRGRRTARMSVAPPAAVEDEGGPAKRTRSRSNSSNSVCSEQSTQASLNEGRRRGRRTTTVIPSEKAEMKQAAHTRSNSISSERSSGSVATRSRGKGATKRKSVKVEEPKEEKEKRKQSTALGRGRGRGGKRPGANEIKAEAAGEEEKEETEISAIAAEDSVMSQSSSRGRKRGADISLAETPQPIPKTPRRSVAGPTHKVLFTGVAGEDGEKVVVRLRGALAKGSSDMTHLVTDKVRRTVKFLCAVARGVPIVTPDWLSKCGKAGSFLSPSGFLVKDVEQEKRFNFSLQDALRVASSQPLLQGYEIHVTPSVKPEPAQMKEIITCCGARFLPKMPSALKAQVVVVSCEEDRALCERAQSLSFPVVSAEFLLTGILQQKVDVQAHALSLSPAASAPKPNVRRRGK